MPKAQRNNGFKNHHHALPGTNWQAGSSLKTVEKKFEQNHLRRAINNNARLSIPSEFRSVAKEEGEKLHYVIDTNAIRHDGDIIYWFHEHTVHLCSNVMKELNDQKNDKEDGHHIRRNGHIISEIMKGRTFEERQKGISFKAPPEFAKSKSVKGKLIVDYSKPTLSKDSPFDLDLIEERDDRTLAYCLSLKEKGKRVVLVTKDLYFREKAKGCGIEAEDYLRETKGIDILSEEEVSKGYHQMPDDIWTLCERSADGVISGRDDSFAKYTLTNKIFETVCVNEFLLMPDGLKLEVVKKISPETVVARTFVNYLRKEVCGIRAKNLLQSLAMQSLCSMDVPLTTLAGGAGTGKTILALAAGLDCLAKGTCEKIIFTKSIVGVAKEESLGFRKGDDYEKLKHALGPLFDSLRKLKNEGKSKGSSNSIDSYAMHNVTNEMLLKDKILVLPIDDVQGQTFPGSYIICDETQNLSSETVKTFVTRAGEGSKMVLLGNGNKDQIKNPNVDVWTNGLAHVIRRLRHHELSGHITLKEVIRSPLAAAAEELL